MQQVVIMQLLMSGVRDLKPKYQSLMIAIHLLMTGSCRGAGPMEVLFPVVGKRLSIVRVVAVRQAHHLGQQLLQRIKPMSLALLLIKPQMA